MSREVVIVEAVRTPMGRRNGVLSGVHPVNLGAKVLNEVVKRASIECPDLSSQMQLGMLFMDGSANVYEVHDLSTPDIVALAL